MSTTRHLSGGDWASDSKFLALALSTWYFHAVAPPESSSNPPGPLPAAKLSPFPGRIRAQRARRLAAFVLATLPLAIAGFALAQPWLGGSQKGPVSVIAAEPEAPTHEPTEASTRNISEEPIPRVATVFGEAPSFRQALLNAGLGPEECIEVEDALQSTVDFRRCRPEHRMVIERNKDATLARFEYHPAATEFVSLSRTPEGVLRAKKISMEVERKVIVKSGSVQTSIGDALEAAGLPSGMSTYFVEAFAGRVNFPLHARKGDVLRIVADEERVEGRLLRYGKVYALEYHGQRTAKLRAFYDDVADGHGRFYDESGRAMQGGWLRAPVRYDRISSRFNPRRLHPVLKRRIPHMGVDYAAPTGTPVWAAADGVVVFAGRKGANGNMVAIRHAGGTRTSYSHLHRIRHGLKRGTQVRQRQLIGAVGSTGRSTGPHLHFALKKKRRFVDPLAELNGPGQRLARRHLKPFKEHVLEMTTLLDTVSDAPSLEHGADVPVEQPIDEIMD